MDVLQAIQSRRSVRRFKADPLPKESVEAILDAARLAPSGKNSQPWRFVVVQNEERETMYACLQAGLKSFRENGRPTGSAEYTFEIMRKAPVTVFVFNPLDIAPWGEQTVLERVFRIVNTQSVGAAIQNMLLRAQELDIGSLWICDTFSAYEELCAWLGRDSLLVAAVSLGYADESPAARPRLPLSDLLEWRG
jgi:nitroreductase